MGSQARPVPRAPSTWLAGGDASSLSPRLVFLRFLRFGFLAWGGPVAQIAMVRRELVDEEAWVSSPRFNRLLAVYQVLPGPEAHEMCVHLGMLKGGRLGGLLAGLGFMLPGFVLMFALSWLYFQVDISASGLAPVFLGVQVGVIALIARAVHRIGRHVLTNPWLWAIGIAATVVSLWGASFWLTLPTAGIVYAAGIRKRYVLATSAAAVSVLIAIALVAGVTPELPGQGLPIPDGASAVGPSLVDLFLSGLKAGLLTFGGAYTVIPFLRADAVGSGWMTDARFLDGLALSGVLPAPLIIFSTFVGFVAAGPLGAIAMTVGIFLPAFGFSLLFHDRLEAVIENTTLHTFLEGVAAGVVGLIVATAFELATALVGRLPSPLGGVAIFALALGVLVLWRAKTSVMIVILGAGIAGLLAFGGS
jgi:chromate transporter